LYSLCGRSLKNTYHIGSVIHPIRVIDLDLATSQRVERNRVEKWGRAARKRRTVSIGNPSEIWRY
jgi:hypothetical protein